MGNCQYNNCRSYLEQGNFSTTMSANNIIDQLTNDFVVLAENSQIQHNLYGKIDLLEYKENKLNEFRLAHKVIIYYDQDEFQNDLQQYELKFHGLNHPNLLIIHAMQHKKLDQFFDTEYKISLFLDYPTKTLAQEIMYRKKMYFEESEILYFLDSLIGALAFLQSKNIIFPSLRFDTIHLVTLFNGALGIKILNPIINSESQMTFKRLFQQKDIEYLDQYPYMSPEQLLMLKNKQIENYNQFKSDVYTLGLMVLEMCSARKSLLLYKDYAIDEVLLKDHLLKLNERYSEQIGLILSAMLQPDPYVRCDFLDLDELLNSSTLRGKRIHSLWTQEDYQYCVSENRRVHFSTKQQSLAHPEINSQLSNQSVVKMDKGSYLSIKQVLSKNSKESRSSSALQQQKETQQQSKKNLFKKFETEQASKGGSKKNIKFQEGFIVESLEDGLTYEGHVVGGKKNGLGKLINDENEIIYDGTFQENQFHRFGVLQNQNPKVCLDPFNYKDFNTIGQSWARYEGDFNQGQKHGFGQLILTNAERFSGQFMDDKIHGTGVFITIQGKQIKGEWINNILVE